MKDLKYTFQIFFIDSRFRWTRWLIRKIEGRNLCLGNGISKHKYKRKPNKDIIYRYTYEDYDTSKETIENDDYIYRPTLFYANIKAVDYNDKVVILKDKTKQEGHKLKYQKTISLEKSFRRNSSRCRYYCWSIYF